MTLFICQEHFQLYMEKVPRRARRATQELMKRSKSVVIVEKEACQVCAGLVARDFDPVLLCESHLRAHYLKQPMDKLKDPSYTLRFICVDPLECSQHKSGKPPE